MHRWMGIISDRDGLDATIQLADDPDASEKLKDIKTNVRERARIVHAINTGKASEEHYEIDSIVHNYMKSRENEAVKQAGGADLGQYLGYDLRTRYANGNLIEVSWIASKSDMDKMKNQGTYQAAIDILNLVLSGKGKIVSKGMTEDDVQDYIDIMKMKVKKENRRKGK